MAMATEEYNALALLSLFELVLNWLIFSRVCVPSCPSEQGSKNNSPLCVHRTHCHIHKLEIVQLVLRAEGRLFLSYDVIRKRGDYINYTESGPFEI